MGIAQDAIACSLWAERLCLHLPQGDQELELPYQIHPGLVQKAELAGLISEYMNRLLPELPQDQPLLVYIPREWGVVVIDLPYTGLDNMPNPAGQVHWELESNAPESARNYYYNYFETAELTRLMAVRKSMYNFLEQLFANCGLRLQAVGVLSEVGTITEPHFVVERADSDALDAAREIEKYRDPTRWSRPLLAVFAILVAAVGVSWVWTHGLPWPSRESQPLEAEQEKLVQAPLDSSVLQLVPDSLLAAAQDSGSSSAVTEAVQEKGTAPLPAVAQPTRNDPLPARQPRTRPAAIGASTDCLDLLRSLAAVEDQLGDFLYLQSDGVYVLSGGLDGAGLIAALPLPARVSYVGEMGHWIHFDRPLAPSTSPTVEASLTVQSLSELSSRLRADPACVVLQRLRGDGEVRGDWFDEQAPAKGWRVRILPRVQ